MSLRFKNRIALFNTIAAAVTTLLIFIVVYAVVYITAYKHLDDEIRLEKDEVFGNILLKGDSLILNMMPEQLEAEHRQAEVSPTFLQIVDGKGQLLFRSSNLNNDHLHYAESLTEPMFFNVVFNDKLIRQGQFPILNNDGKPIGQLDIGLPQEESILILKNLRITLCISFPLMLLAFYLATSWAASRGIAPVHKLIRAAGAINDMNMSTRLPVPLRHDEIHQLGTTINALLGRIEMSLIREKQITADISHELRTPITSIRGTLEVLIRKTRDPMQYEDKIRHVIGEVDMLNKIIDQLLQLSRLDAGNLPVAKTTFPLINVINTITDRLQHRLSEKHMTMQITFSETVTINADQGFLEIMLENLISNAFKYGREGQLIAFAWDKNQHTLYVSDNGHGIPREHLPYLFNRFYRTDASRSSQVQGNGLGLSIVKKLADLQQITIDVTSNTGTGTTFSLHFNS